MRGVRRGFTLPPFPLRRPHARAPGSSPRAPFLRDERSAARRSAHKPAHWNEPNAMPRPQCIDRHLLVPRPLHGSLGHLGAPLGAPFDIVLLLFLILLHNAAFTCKRGDCSFALRYTCGDGFNENDLRHFTDALNEQLAEGNTYTALAILANEGDRREHPAQVVHSPTARRRSWERLRARRERCRTR